MGCGPRTAVAMGRNEPRYVERHARLRSDRRISPSQWPSDCMRRRPSSLRHDVGERPGVLTLAFPTLPATVFRAPARHC
jgi:hypothetical protein